MGNYISVIFVEFVVVVETVIDVYFGVTVAMSLNIFKSWTSPIICWMIAETKGAFCWKVLAFRTSG